MFMNYVSSLFFGHMLQACYVDVAYVSHIRCMCFIWMLRMVAMVFKCFFEVFQKHISSVSTTFRRMLQLLYLDVSKVD